MKKKYKDITQKEFELFKQHPRVKLLESSTPSLKYYLCNESLVIEDTKSKVVRLYPDKDDYLKFLKELDYNNKMLFYDKYEKYVVDINAFNASKAALIKDLFDELHLQELGADYKKITIPQLAEIIEGIKKYGTEKVFDSMFLNIVAFIGEYTISQKGGSWAIRKNILNKNIPVLVFHDNTEYDIVLRLHKDFAKRKTIDIQSQILSAMQQTL